MNTTPHRCLKLGDDTPAAASTLSSKTGPLRALFVSIAVFLCLPSGSQAATFTNNASIQVNDPTSSLTCTGTTFTASCWFRISLPSSLTLSDNMDILMDRTDGNESASFSYLIRYNCSDNAIEFVTQGASSSPPPYVLIRNPYLERWYHVAVIRSGSAISAYVDGRPILPSESAPVGSTTGSGLAIGGVNGSSKQFYGDIIEVAFYSSALTQSAIQSRMFQDQRNFSNLKGYYKLGYSTNAADFYHNFAATPPSGTDPATPTGTGTVSFGEVDEAGEQSIFDATKNHGEDAATPLSGAFAWQQTALARPVPGIAFDLEYGYSSALPTQAPLDGSADPYDTRVLGPRWRQSFDVRVVLNEFNQNEFDLITWDGEVQTWTRTNLYAPFSNRDKEYRGELIQLPTAEVQWTTPQRLVYLFHDPTDETPMAGKLEQISDFNSNLVQVLWDEDNAIVTNVIDTVAGVYHFNYDLTKFLLTNVSFGSWQVNFAYDATNQLISKTLTNTAGLYTAVNTTWQFQYNTNGLLQQIVDPRGNTNVLVQYDQYGRQTNQVDALNRATRTEYNLPATWQMRRTDPGSFQWIETYDHKGHILAQTDPLTNMTSYTYDTNGNRTSVTEPLGWTTSFGYDIRANMIAKTNALGEVTTWVIHPFFNKAVQQVTPQPPDANGWTTWTNFYAYNAGGNLTNHSDALGSLVTYTYSTNGLLLAATDANGNTTLFAYDGNGFMNARTDPATNTTSYILNDIGWKLHETDALGDPTSYEFDLNGNVIRVQDVLGRVFNKLYDAGGNLLSATDGKGQPTSNAYDAANQRTNMTDRTGTNKWAYFYTLRGKPDHVTDPLGNSVTNTYDSANRLVRVTDPLGQSVTNQYDANGNLAAYFDKTGQRWTKVYDRLNRVISETNPLGNSRTTGFDVADRIQQITSPNGYPSINAYDGRGRLTKWVDPQAFPWLYSYDGVGNITNITDSLGGHYVMAYDSRNERTLEQNQDSKQWTYSYDELLRLKSQTDPNGTIRTPTYDAAGRALFVNFSTGRRDSFNYDGNDNPQTVSRRYSGVTTATDFIYDPLDRVVEQDDALGKTVLYGYDPLGRVTSITYPGGKTLTNHYDALGRLTSQADWAARQMTYSYDAADRLVSRTYPNGVAQTNTFDAAGRITSLNYSPPTVTSNSINIALSYAYDRNGNKTGGGESGAFNWPLPSVTDDQSTFTAAGRLINRQIVESSPSNSVNAINYHYDASGNMTNAVGDGQTWTLTYDEDNRTTAILWTNGALNDVQITNRYDALGRRISKTANAVTTGYVLSVVSGMERVLCDLDGSGNITAWYVHGPDLCYRVDTTNGLICYHADAQANIVALTDANANLAAQYAYTPYGRSLGSTTLPSLISNPYSFVGSQGVMEESEIPNLYFMRARYYSAEVGAFLSTDPLKKIGPSWKPSLYSYVDSNPCGRTDPSGKAIEVGFGALYGVAEHLHEIWTGQATGWTVIKYAVEDGIGIGLSLALPEAAAGNAAMTATLGVANSIGNVTTAVSVAADVYQGLNSRGGFLYDVGSFVTGAYMAGINAAGSALERVLPNNLGVGGSASYTWNSPTAGTTPMAALNRPQTAANQVPSASTASAGITANNLNGLFVTPQAAPTSGSGSTSSSSTSITIPSGATLSGLAAQNHTTVANLMNLNPQITNPNLIYAGATLRTH